MFMERDVVHSVAVINYEDDFFTNVRRRAALLLASLSSISEALDSSLVGPFHWHAARQSSNICCRDARLT